MGDTDVVAMVRDRVACRPGERVGFVPDAARIHVFDATSGARLAA
jgi:multiple sugar transport system ATP-binding protein